VYANQPVYYCASIVSGVTQTSLVGLLNWATAILLYLSDVTDI